MMQEVRRWYQCGGCSSHETGKPAGYVSSGNYEGPQCENCWDVELQEQAAEEQWWSDYEAAVEQSSLE